MADMVKDIGDMNLDEMVEERNMLDFSAYQMLVDLLDNGELPGTYAREVRQMRDRRRSLDTGIVRFGTPLAAKR